MHLSFITVLGLAATQSVSAIRVLTGECRPGQDLLGIETARRVANGIAGRKHDWISWVCVYNSLVRHASRPLAMQYGEQIGISRMEISRQLFEYLLEFSRDQGEERATDAQTVWDEYLSSHPDDTTADCATMQVWYTTASGLGSRDHNMLDISETSVKIKEEYIGLVAYVDLTRIAGQSNPLDRMQPIDQFTRSYERYVAAKSSIGSLVDLETALGRPARLVAPDDFAIILKDRDSILTDYARFDEFDTMRSVGPRILSLSAEWHVDMEQADYAVEQNEFTGRLIHEIVSGTFSYVSPSWDEVRQVLQADFPEVNKRTGPKYKRLKYMFEQVVETISLPGKLFHLLVAQSVTPAQLGPAQIAWVSKVLTPHIGKTIGSIDLFVGRSDVYRVYIPRSLDLVRELLETRFGAITIPPRAGPAAAESAVAARPLLHRIPGRERIWKAFNPVVEPTADAPGLPEVAPAPGIGLLLDSAVEEYTRYKRAQAFGAAVLLTMKRPRTQSSSSSSESSTLPSDGLDLLLTAADIRGNESNPSSL